MKDTWVISYMSYFDNVVNLKQVKASCEEEALLCAMMAGGYDVGFIVNTEVTAEELIKSAYDLELAIGAIKVK